MSHTLTSDLHPNDLIVNEHDDGSATFEVVRSVELPAPPAVVATVHTTRILRTRQGNYSRPSTDYFGAGILASHRVVHPSMTGDGSLVWVIDSRPHDRSLVMLESDQGYRFVSISNTRLCDLVGGFEIR